MRRARRVNQYDGDGRLITTYPSASAAATRLGVSRQTIYNAIWQGSTFRFEEEEVREEAIVEDAVPYYTRLLHYATTLTQDEEWAKDLVQEAYLSYYEHFTAGRAKAYTFLYSCVKGEWLRDMKKRSLTLPITDLEFRIGREDEDAEERELQLTLRDRQMKRVMGQCFNSIKTEKHRKRTRKVFQMYTQGCSSGEVAARFHIKNSSAKQEIIKMRKHVCSYFHIPLKSFTQKVCEA